MRSRRNRAGYAKSCGAGSKIGDTFDSCNIDRPGAPIRNRHDVGRHPREGIKTEI